METEPRAEGTLPRRSEVIFGREDDLDSLAQRASATSATSELVCIIGEGGLGKTRLIEAFAAYLDREGLPFAPLIDFYHVDNFRAGVIEETIALGLRARTPPHFWDGYMQARQRLEDARSGGQAFDQAQRAVREAFVEAYNQLAEALAGEGRRVVLLFDTVEQAISLSDGADRRFDLPYDDLSVGGEVWLRATLPRLKNTLLVLGGRAETLYGQPVSLYADLGARLPRHTITPGGLDREAAAALARQMLADARAGADEQTAGIASALDLDDPTKLRAWYELSQGHPFWIAVLFTLELIGGEPGGVLNTLQEEVGRLAPDAPLPDDRREALRAALRERFLGAITQDAPALLVALQCMASLRKGLTPDLLERLLARLKISDPPDPAVLFARLSQLAMVKLRRTQRYTRRGDRPNDPSDQETMLFLHDELYAWLDTHPLVRDESRQVVLTTVREWYDRAIARVKTERQEAVEAWLFLDADAPEAAQRAAERDDAQRRLHQLQRDRLSYVYAGAAEGPGEAAAYLQLLSYEAIFARDAGHVAALHQEALRNLYRRPGAQPSASPLDPADELAFAALWLLRMAVQYENLNRTLMLLERLERFRTMREQAMGAGRAFFELATAIAHLYTGRATRPEERREIERALDEAEKALASTRDASAALTLVERRWLELLESQTLNFRGYFHRRNYELAEAVAHYRRSIALSHQEKEPPFPQFHATTLNNLGFALAEQGDTEEAERVVREALMIRLRHGTAYDVAYSRNVLARVLLRAGEPFRARHYAEQAAGYMRSKGGTRGLLHVLTVLAEACRKAGELLDDAPLEQDRVFAQGRAALDEAERELRTLERPLAETERLVLQTRGCLYRSQGAVWLRRGPVFAERAARLFDDAHHWLEQALAVAREHHEPPLVQMDILEDLAALYVREDQYDERLYRLLDEAEALAPEPYRAQEGLGPVEVERATRGYWRELGQCQLQRMLSAFGKFDFGEPREITPPGDPKFLDEAAEHLVLMMAYLCRYNRHSWMLVTARRLTLRELLLRTVGELDRFARAAYEAARRYNLLYDESFAVAEQVIAVARTNLAPQG
jgi:tetratricopeptide (TPR) repeat protein